MKGKITKFKSGYDKHGTYYEYNLGAKGIPTIFIHGVGLNTEMWSKQKNLLSSKTLLYDLINHGKTEKHLKTIKYIDFNLQLKNLIDFFDLKKINIVGFSIGSIIALNFSTKFNYLINKLVLISTVYNRSKLEQKSVISRYRLANNGKNISELAIKRWFTDGYIKKNPRVCKKFLKILNQNKIEKFLPSYKLFANTKKNLFNFDQFKTPTMIITGEKDMNSTPAMSLNLNKKIKNSKLLIIPKGKHMAYHENSVSINPQIKKFLH